MASLLTELGIDCRDPQALAGFWSQVLDYDILSDEPGLVTIGPRTRQATGQGGAPIPAVLTFAWVPEGKVVKNRLHMDLRPVGTSQAAEVQRLMRLGARRADIGQAQCSWVVMVDPEGNEFCVLSRAE
ncbi:VOC family protein [Glutamicibacter sp. MNS18]|uniref:VOC family protein n=1 Tax=Glutamicibacter sp. MNS18 TaxID=2989817 RepID=UPI0022368FCE|nr:VOC family protein [Glutamicibacter sp. MNS18]MCW4465868.1 VOC family protein [Glutamicibacter sp. MNS18]